MKNVGKAVNPFNEVSVGTDDLSGVVDMVEGWIAGFGRVTSSLSVLIEKTKAERKNLPARVNSILSTCTNKDCDSEYFWQGISTAEEHLCTD